MQEITRDMILQAAQAANEEQRETVRLAKMIKLSEALQDCNREPVVSSEQIAVVLSEEIQDISELLKMYVKERKKATR